MPVTPSAALPAFLRGIERRARTLAEAQCGDPARAAAVWDATAATFTEQAAEAPVASWPVLFWARLLGHPDLATPALPGGTPLGTLGPGPRAALLLRLVAGLDPRPAAEVLGVSEPTYRFALQRALEQARAAGIDADALRRLREAWQRQPAPAAPSRAVFVPAPPPPFPPLPGRPADHVVDAAKEDAPTPAPAAPAVVAGGVPPWRSRRRRLVAVGAVAVAALVATLFWPATPPPPARPVPLTPALVEAAPPPLATHPDYALIAGADDEVLAQDLAFLSWLAASGAAATPGDASEPPAPAAGATP